MTSEKCKVQNVVAFMIVLLASRAVASPFSFDDVDYWVGNGANQAALVIDWVEEATEPPALAWGYRWDGTATGRDMLLAIVAADDRLFAKLGGSPADPVIVYGLGYDANDDGQFAIDDDTAFDDSGIAFGSAPFFPAATTDAGDYYAEGWTFDFWHYGIAASNPYEGGSWSDIPLGMVGRVLTNGAWDSWALEQVPAQPPFVFTSYAENPQAALAPELPPPELPGDFDGNHRVDDADYQLWKSQFGSTGAPAADANQNGVVDAADYTIWRNNLGASSLGAAAAGLSVPEPSSLFALIVLGVLCSLLFSSRKVRSS